MVNKEWEDTIKEIKDCRESLVKQFGSEYPVNAIQRMVLAYIKLEKLSVVPKESKEAKE